MISIKRYSLEDKATWDSFVKEAKNASFIHNRDFMEYHAERFTGHSLIIFNKSKICAVFPANQDADNVVSHRGLGYGGLILQKSVKLQTVLKIFYHLLKYYHDNNVREITYRAIPSFFTTHASCEEEYAFFLLKAEICRRDTSFTIDLENKLPYQTRRIRSIRKANSHGVFIKLEDSVSSFWEKILIPNLQERYRILPVHSAAEMSLLKSRFPDNIKQYNAYYNDEIVAGTTVYIINKTAHCQYISTCDKGRQVGAIDFLFDYLINKEFSGFRYFSFGISNEKDGKELNRGLTDWKEGFGARAWSV